MKRSWVWMIGLMCLTAGLAEAQEPAWELISQEIAEAELVAVAAGASDPRHLYAGSLRGVYHSVDGGASWQRVLRLPGQSQLTFLAVDPFDPRHALAATTRGVYGTEDGGESWRLLLRGADGDEANGRVITFHPSRRHEVWLGTAGGVLVSRDGGRSWRSAGPEVNGRSIRFVTIDPNPPHRGYVLTDDELLAVDAEEATWQSLFSLTGVSQPPDELEEAASAAVEESQHAGRLTALAIDQGPEKTLYLSSLDGLYTSTDGGASWQPLTSLGLGTPQIHHLILHRHSPTVAYVATPNGVARYVSEEQRWEPLYTGLPTQATRFLAASPQHIFVATDQGLYMLDLTMEQLAQGNWPGAAALLGNFVHEPAIGDVQQTAIRYAEVHPEKIANWRKQARLRALIPTFTMSGNTEMGDFRHWDDHGTTGQDTLMKGERDIDWSGNVTWDLSHFIYSDDQTNIDVRSKLMVELRDSILDDVTRSYFERRRLQVELITNPPADPKAQLAKELRIQELTAILDGLTGGWFSRELERRAR